MRVILGLDAPDAGRALVSGRSYRDLPWPLREVGAHLDTRAFHATLEIVGLAAVARKRAGTFSLCMSQRLGIAAALLGDPGTLLFDEPINGLDPDGIRWIRNLVRGLAAEGRTVLLSSHLISEMELTADHLVVIGRGHVRGGRHRGRGRASSGPRAQVPKRHRAGPRAAPRSCSTTPPATRSSSSSLRADL
jgi:ABC-2 type transport system ATP-binding protein